MSSSIFICRQCAVKHAVKGWTMTSIIEMDSETYNEIETIHLVQECPDCWDPVLRRHSEHKS